LVAAIYPETRGVSLEELEQRLGVANWFRSVSSKPADSISALPLHIRASHQRCGKSS